MTERQNYVVTIDTKTGQVLGASAGESFGKGVDLKAHANYKILQATDTDEAIRRALAVHGEVGNRRAVCA